MWYGMAKVPVRHSIWHGMGKVYSIFASLAGFALYLKDEVAHSGGAGNAFVLDAPEPEAQAKPSLSRCTLFQAWMNGFGFLKMIQSCRWLS